VYSRDGLRDDAQREVRDRRERRGRVDERHEIVERFEVHDRRRDLDDGRIKHVQSANTNNGNAPVNLQTSRPESPRFAAVQARRTVRSGTRRFSRGFGDFRRLSLRMSGDLRRSPARCLANTTIRITCTNVNVRRLFVISRRKLRFRIRPTCTRI